MTATTRLVLKNLILILVGLILIPPTCIWGQALQTPPGVVSPDGASSSQVQAAADASSQPASDKTDLAESGTGFSFLRVVGGLGLVLSLIVLGTFGIRKFAPQYFVKRTPERNLKVIETLPMGERRSIAVIEIDERRLLIGNTPNQITLLAALSESPSLRGEQESATPGADSQATASTFKNLYEFEKNGPARVKKTIIPPDIRAKMRQLRESLER